MTNRTGDNTDEPARVAIRTALDTTMMVEAGAGSGKTTLMVDRLLAYVARGTPVEQLAAVTFTRKAANELRERLENRLDAESRNAERNSDERERLIVALRERERMFVGTVHSFCGRVLREHALEAGLPPDFSELDESETTTLRDASYREYIEHALRGGAPELSAIQELGIDGLRLLNSFREFEQYRDVEFAAPAVARPAHEKVRDQLIAFLERGFALRAGLSDAERDKLQTVSDRLWRRYRTHGEWKEATVFASDASVILSASQTAIVQKRWGDSAAAKKAAKEYGADFQNFIDGTLRPWFDQWWAHAYPAIINIFRAASDAALARRRRNGQLGFDDLLTETAALLRNNADARRVIGDRWRHLLVDEFQDTDPVQAEVCFLISSDPAEGANWRTVVPRPGSLFVVGDPKQSIYRFRRADLAVYRFVQERIAACGQLVQLTRNFRSVPEIGTLVNTHFEQAFPPADSAANDVLFQAPFAEFVAASTRAPHAGAGIKRYWIGSQGNASKEELIAEDSALLASWIAKRCFVERDRTPGDFLILTANKRELNAYAHQLALRNIAVSATGVASSIGGVLRELLIVVNALSDPRNPVAVIAALEGWCIGCSHQDLWDAREQGLEFRITHAPAEQTSTTGHGLHQLHRWWVASQQTLAASLLEQVMDESGLFVLAASNELGDRSAGQLLQLVALLRGSARTDLAAAMEAIQQALSEDEDEPGLRVGRTDAVQLMNLHKAKGLEAPVVVLAAPVPKKPMEPSHATWRDENGQGQGALEVCDDNAGTIARPLNWTSVASEEINRDQAEHARLLYVAVTRARDELIVGQRAPYTLASKEVRADTSRWSPLAAVLAMQATELSLSVEAPPGRRALPVSAAAIEAGITQARERLQHAKRSRFTLVSVTETAKRDAARAHDDGTSVASEVADIPGAGASGMHSQSGDSAEQIGVREFGTLAHAALEGALRGRNDAELREYVRALVWHAVQSSSTDRESLVNNVMHAVSAARNSDAWPLLVARGALAELNVASSVAGDAGGPRVLSEGIVDAVVSGDDGWIVVDWKFSAANDARWRAQLPAYQAQTEGYVATLRLRTGIGGRAHIERVAKRSSD